jgi:hypothetical protein
MFHKEIKDAEEKRTKICCNLFPDNTLNVSGPEEMNDFITNLMDPFNNSAAQTEDNFDTYYEDYYKLYDIEQPEIKKDRPNSQSFRMPFSKN